MTEFTTGIFELFKRLMKGSSVTLALIYTAGHIVIAMSVVSTLTGASLWEAGAWFYVLHSLWKKLQN